MKTEDKIRELELEIARLKGVIEGMKTPYVRTLPVYPSYPSYPNYPHWPNVWCSTSPAVVPYTNGTTSTTANFGPTTISGMN